MAQLKWEGLSKIKIALTGTDTSSLTRLLEGCFGSVEPSPPSPPASTDVTEPTEEHPAEEVSGSDPSFPVTESSLATAELVFPMKSIPLIVAGIPEVFLPLCSPETLSLYRCQYPNCTQAFSQKVAACNHICCNHLNVALACIYCSGKENPKMHWYSASAWESHVHKHTQDDLPIFPDDLTFAHLPLEAIPPTSSSTSKPLLANVILERAKAAKQYLGEEAAKSTPPKHHIKQGPVKSRKKQKDK